MAERIKVLVAESLVGALQAEDDLEVIVDDVTRLDHHDPEVLVFDRRQLGDTGLGLIVDIRDAAPNVAIVLTGIELDHDEIVAAVTAGCIGILPRGAPSHELIRAVRAAATGEATISSEALRVLAAPREGAKLVVDLTDRELSVLEGLAAGRTNLEIASALSLSPSTIRNHMQALLMKLDAHSKLEALVKAVRAGIVSVAGPD